MQPYLYPCSRGSRQEGGKGWHENGGWILQVLCSYSIVVSISSRYYSLGWISVNQKMVQHFLMGMSHHNTARLSLLAHGWGERQGERRLGGDGWRGLEHGQIRRSFSSWPIRMTSHYWDCICNVQGQRPDGGGRGGHTCKMLCSWFIVVSSSSRYCSLSWILASWAWQASTTSFRMSDSSLSASSFALTAAAPNAVPAAALTLTADGAPFPPACKLLFWANLAPSLIIVTFSWSDRLQ